MIYEWIVKQPLVKQPSVKQPILLQIENTLDIRILEKNKFGEVNTPQILIDELLDNLPSNVWSNSKLTWLDPAAGIGNFPMLIYNRLFTSLTKEFPNSKKRHNHIVEKMLYMVELNKESAKKLVEIFGKNANIYHRSFLEPIADKTFLEKFDIIIGNPPYQSSKKSKYLGSAGNKTLWDKFIWQAFSKLAENGFLAFISPNSWRRPESKLYDIMTRQNQLLFLHIYGKKDGLDIFGVQTRFDSYIIQHTNVKSTMKLIDEKGDVYQDFDIASWPFLPNYNYENIQKILAKPGEPTLKVLFDSSLYDARKLTKNKTKKYKYPIVHTITKKGLGLRYTQKPPQNQHKVLLNFNEQQYPYNDYKGEYGMTQLTFGLPIQSKIDGDKLIEKINSPEFREIIKATKWSAFQTDYRMFNYFNM
jgi:hypothetical protein